MALLLIPDADRLKAAGYAAVANIPVLFDNQHRYCREYNRFLRERAVGEWAPNNNTKSRHERLSPSTAIIRPRTLLNLSYALKNWIEWCAARQVEWRTADYVHDLLTWRDDMLAGIWLAH